MKGYVYVNNGGWLWRFTPKQWQAVCEATVGGKVVEFDDFGGKHIGGVETIHNWTHDDWKNAAEKGAKP